MTADFSFFYRRIQTQQKTCSMDIAVKTYWHLSESKFQVLAIQKEQSILLKINENHNVTILLRKKHAKFYYTIKNTISVQLFNQPMSTYKTQYVLVTGWNKHQLFSELELMYFFPCYSICKYKGLLSITTVADLTSNIAQKEHLQTIINFNTPTLSKLLYSMLKLANKQNISQNLLLLFPKLISHNDYCVNHS